MNSLYIFLFTKIASTEGFIVATLLVTIYLFFYHTKKIAFYYFVTVAFLLAAVQSLKVFFQVPRPSLSLIEITGYGFPSGHATGSLFLALTIAYLTRNLTKPVRYAIWFIAASIALFIGASRIHLGVHTPLQVVGGYTLGVFCWYIFLYLKRYY